MTTIESRKAADIEAARRQSEDVPDPVPAPRSRRKIMTSERAIATVATALAAYLAVRTESIAKHAGGSEVADEIRATVTELRANVTNLTQTVNSLGTTVTGLQTTVNGLDKTVDKIDAKVDSLSDSKTAFEAALNSFRMSSQNLEFRLGRLETEIARAPSRRQ